MANINDTIERKLLPLANKMSSWRYLKAIRDSFLTLLPISLTGGIASVLGAAPFPKEEAEGFYTCGRCLRRTRTSSSRGSTR